MNQNLTVVFAGTPEFAAVHLSALLQDNFNVIGVYTPPDKPSGRGKKLQACAVKQVAVDHQIPVFQPKNFKLIEDQEALRQLNPDIMVVVAYGLLLPKAVLEIPRLGCINVHGSLLPKWRGAAPIQRAIWAGDSETGVTIMQMDEGLDTGDMLSKASLPINADDTSATLYEKLAQLGPPALIQTLHDIESIQPEKQNTTQANYAKKLTKEEALIDWNMPAEQIERNIRAFNPWPFAYFMIGENRIKVWAAKVAPTQTNKPIGTIISAGKQGIEIQTGKGVIIITQLQIPGKKAMSVQDVLNGKSDWFNVETVLS